MISNTKIQHWWQINFPNEALVSVKKPSSGCTSHTYVLNDEVLLKIYISKDGDTIQSDYFNNGKIAVDKVQGIQECLTDSILLSEMDDIFGAPIRCMRFLESSDLSNFLYKLDSKETIELAHKIGLIIKKIHKESTIVNQEYDTQHLIDLAKKALEIAAKNQQIEKNYYDTIFEFVKNYDSRIIKTDFVLVHSDLHPENYLKSKDGKYYIIDFDLSFVGWNMFELRKLIHAALVPSFLVNDTLDSHYPNKSMIPFFKGLMQVYPELFDSIYLNEIKLSLIPKLLFYLSSPKDSIDYRLNRDLFHMVFEDGVLEEIFNLELEY
jgi:Phosphotransferase enzyme family